MKRLKNTPSSSYGVDDNGGWPGRCTTWNRFLSGLSSCPLPPPPSAVQTYFALVSYTRALRVFMSDCLCHIIMMIIYSIIMPAQCWKSADSSRRFRSEVFWTLRNVHTLRMRCKSHIIDNANTAHALWSHIADHANTAHALWITYGRQC